MSPPTKCAVEMHLVPIFSWCWTSLGAGFSTLHATLPLHKDILGAELAGILGMLLLPAWTTCADDDSAVGISLAQRGARLLESIHFMTFMMQRSPRRKSPPAVFVLLFGSNFLNLCHSVYSCEVQGVRSRVNMYTPQSVNLQPLNSSRPQTKTS